MFRSVMPIGAINELSVSRPHYEANREIELYLSESLFMFANLWHTSL